MAPELSICITAYNQKDFIKWNISNILQSKCDNFEIVIQDDCSTENIEEIAYSYNDSRIKYYRNSVNLGHDSNILRGIKNCKSNYVFLLRSTDTLIANEIETIIEFIKDNPYIGYCRFSCLDDYDKERLIQKNIIASKGNESVLLHSRLLIHPSGELYNKAYFSENDYIIFDRYLNRYFSDNKKFIVHVMMREKLAIYAGIASSSYIVWKYTYTDKRKDIAQNKSSNGLGIYHPSYQYKRLECELNYVVRELSGAGRTELIKEIIHRYAKQIIFLYWFINKNKKMQQHYAFEASEFSPLKELSIYKKAVSFIAAQFNESDYIIVTKELKKISFFSILWWSMERVFFKLLKILCQ